MPRLTRRRFLTAASAAMTVGCGRKTGSGFPGYALVATAGENSISVLDLANFRLSKQVELYAAPQEVLGGARRSYISTPRSGSIHAVDRTFTRVASRKLDDELGGCKLTPDEKHLLAIAASKAELIEVETETLRLIRRWKLAAPAKTLDVSSNGDVALSGGENGIIQFIDRRTGKQNCKQLDGALGAVLFRADGKLLLAANYQQQTLTALDVPSLETVVDLPLAMRPENLCFSADGGQLFISGRGMDGIAIAFTYAPLEIEQTILGGRDPGVMACSANKEYLFVASASGSDVSILTVDRRRMIGLVEVGKQPDFIAITPDSRFALVLNRGSSDVAVVRVSSIREKLNDAARRRNKSGASLFTMIPVGAQPVQAAIVSA